MFALPFEIALRFHWSFEEGSRCCCSFGDVSPVGPDSMEAALPATTSAIEAIQTYNSSLSSHNYHTQLRAHKHLHGQSSAVPLLGRMQLTTVMKDTRMVSRFAHVQQRIFQYRRIACSLALPALIATSVLFPARLRRFRGTHQRWRGRCPGIIKKRLRLYINKIHSFTSDRTSEIGKRKRAAYRGAKIASTALTLRMHNPARAAHEVGPYPNRDLRGKLMRG